MLSVFSVEYKVKRKFTFLGVNTKYISFRLVKNSAFSLVLRTRENTDFFHRTRRNIFGIHPPKVNILYVFTNTSLQLYVLREVRAWHGCCALRLVPVFNDICSSKTDILSEVAVFKLALSLTISDDRILIR